MGVGTRSHPPARAVGDVVDLVVVALLDEIRGRDLVDFVGAGPERDPNRGAANMNAGAGEARFENLARFPQADSRIAFRSSLATEAK
jgi:hypothetical protein